MRSGKAGLLIQLLVSGMEGGYGTDPSQAGKTPGASVLTDVLNGLVTTAFRHKVVANARSQQRTISVADNLRNHQEADWIADRILQAAR